MTVIKTNWNDKKILARLLRIEAESEGEMGMTQRGYFYQSSRDSEICLAQKVIDGQRFHPATNVLWYDRPEGVCPSFCYTKRRKYPNVE